MAMAGAGWKALDDKGKEPYEALAVKDKARHAKQKEEYDSKGFYTRVDGSKSNADAKAEAPASKSKSPVIKKQSVKARAAKTAAEESKRSSVSKRSSPSKIDSKRSSP